MNIWHALIGRPLKDREEQAVRVGVIEGLSVLAPDALSSVAYGTQEILIELQRAGITALWYVLPISAVIVVLLTFLVISYRQIIRSYPGGGGAYVIGRDTLGADASLIAGAALLIDYTLTVAVSVTAGVAAVVAAFPVLTPWTVGLSVAIVIVLAILNLRGLRESARAFALPTYLFIFMILLMAVVGLFKPLPEAPPWHSYITPPLGAVGLFVVLRAFSSGSSALTGIEAISNGVPIFQEPAPTRARTTLLLLGLFLGSMFLGTSIISYRYHIIPSANTTVLQQLAADIFGRGIFFYGLSFVTMAILAIAANTSFAGFPQLSSIMARDQWMPRMFLSRGDRLVYQNGVIILALVAIILIVGFGGNTTNLIPLYAIGVYLSFTIAMLSLAVKTWRNRTQFSKRAVIILVGMGLMGATLTALVVIVSLITKFTQGAWIVALALPLLIWGMRKIRRHYRAVADELRVTDYSLKPVPAKIVAVVPVNSINRLSIKSLSVALGLAEEVVALHVVRSQEPPHQFEERWEKWNPDPRIKLAVVPTQYRSVVRPVVRYVDLLSHQNPENHVVIILPELIVRYVWEHFLHNQLALTLETVFIFRKNVTVMIMPYKLQGH
ncbi:amino acid/polyamine/organocation transporter, APC superfamily [Sulfobacillus thermosulfidooxidans DSM 9293]|uniref:Amino acid/polyamine/organocation transporter, APC superfamily n=1 Tax=Sulfobacillus thermosulfidooxidans (strain DSM 9293 / VKM B-1269 / AT-1) TaxID=929705 RepID=A0A1W1W8G1_SULTA|nr:APC family permease [Sulfobacillus thermosulfidooxidans]SMC02581.1 amino acid/polyamine/organocation transporter, APC superfamily [Sulfobacillus thermosulfidooxidans DSM 9293]